MRQVQQTKVLSQWVHAWHLSRLCTRQEKEATGESMAAGRPLLLASDSSLRSNAPLVVPLVSFAFSFRVLSFLCLLHSSSTRRLSPARCCWLALVVFREEHTSHSPLANAETRARPLFCHPTRFGCLHLQSSNPAESKEQRDLCWFFLDSFFYCGACAVMVRLTITPHRGNHARTFQHTGHLGLSPVSLAGVLQTSVEEDGALLDASSVQVRIRCYEAEWSNSCKALNFDKVRVAYEVSQTLWSSSSPASSNSAAPPPAAACTSKSNSNSIYKPLGNLKAPWRLSIPVSAIQDGALSSATYKRWRIWWALEAGKAFIFFSFEKLS